MRIPLLCAGFMGRTGLPQAKAPPVLETQGNAISEIN
jgi:hypothetical protein